MLSKYSKVYKTVLRGKVRKDFEFAKADMQITDSDAIREAVKHWLETKVKTTTQKQK